jgi:PAS domain S-box-containing protein
MNIQNRTTPGLGDQRQLAPIDARLAATYEHAGIVEVDENGRMLRVNQQLCELTGYSAAQLLGRTIFEETHPEDVSEDRGQFQCQLAGEFERYSIEKRIARKDGEGG